MDFLQKNNHDNTFFRSLYIGLISVLNQNITYPQLGKDNVFREIYIPFLPSMVGDEPFLMDYFLDYGDCDGNPAFAEGNYDVIPRGTVEQGSCQINTSSSTSKYVRATYSKEIKKNDGSVEMKSFSAYLNPIPLIQTYRVRIKVDTELEAFKIQARVVELLYKNFVYYFEYNGLRIPAQGSMPDTVGDRNKIFTYSYSNNRDSITLEFGVSIETYLPQLDLTTERFRGNLMQGGIKLNTQMGNTTIDPDGKELLHGIDSTKNGYTVTYTSEEGNQNINLT